MSLAYQPKVDRHGRITGVEALVRWRMDGRPISPALFVPIAEEAGLILELGEWVIQEAIEFARRWPTLSVAINLSPAQLRDDDFAMAVEGLSSVCLVSSSKRGASPQTASSALANGLLENAQRFSTTGASSDRIRCGYPSSQRVGGKLRFSGSWFPDQITMRHYGLLRRLRSDRTANAAVLMATAMIPLAALAGSALDVTRMYVVKSRIQQACDAGVLAGRRFMVTDGNNTLDANAALQAKTFFANNFKSGWFGSGQPVFTPVKTVDQQVAGTASVTVPMTLMKIFGMADAALNVSCKARYDVADTDIVFVLDTTGSMACRPEDNDTECNNYVSANTAQPYARPSNDPYATSGYLGSIGYGVPETSAGNGSRIRALRQAVKDFYAVIASSVDNGTRVRYGFVSYTSTVNAGKAIYQVSPTYLIGGYAGETASYQSRKVTADYQISWTGTATGQSSDNCPYSWGDARSPAAPLTYNASGVADVTGGQQWNGRDGKCYIKVNRTVGPQYTYQKYDWDVSRFIAGETVLDPTKVKGERSAWDGCIEERSTQSGTTSFNSSSYDLDPTLVPNGNIATRWRPMWADAEYYRQSGTDTTNGDDPNYRQNYGNVDFRRKGFYSCGKPILPLSEMSATAVSGYVDATDFRPLGGTYHDTGMIWGTRLLAPGGIFAATNSGRAGQPLPRKVIVFLTDGDMAPNDTIYGLYGVERFDRRVSDGDTANLTAYHNARFLYACEQARQLGVDVWTVAIDTEANSNLTKCARNSSQALYTATGGGLTAIFQKIAKQVAMLRMEQ